MARRCPPGVICVQNALFISMFIFLVLLLAFFVYRSTISLDKTMANNLSVLSHNQNQQMNSSNIQSKGFSSLFDNTPLQGLFPRPSYSYSNMENDVLMNPYSAPHRDDRVFNFNNGDVRGGIPINVRTQGVDSSYRQIGILTRQNGSEMILPLMGRPLITNRDKWQFYTMNDNNIKLPIVNKGKSCTNEYGCDNLYNGDTVFVEGLGDAFKVTVYDNAMAKYLPFV
jgi:hypothetical protein